MISPSDILHGKILIVDDHEANVALLEQMLRDAGYDAITTTTNPCGVCELHRINLYDLIILDLTMPGMDGFQVMHELKGIEPNGYLPVLVITAYPDHRLRALAAGANDFLSSPFDHMEAKTRIHNMLEVRLLYKRLEQSNCDLSVLALHDALTGLPNRRLLLDRLGASIIHAHRNQHLMALLYLDMDGFKRVNETLGHDGGDVLLKMIAARMANAVRQEDTVARLGGDEFVIVLCELNHADGIAKPVEKVLHAVSQPYCIQGHNVSISASIGVSIYPAHGKEAKTLMKNADMALFEAKRAGKNSYRIAACSAAGDDS